jgi:chromosome segregation ATPase
MKSLFTNLLIVVCLGLCALLAYQWSRGSNLRRQLLEESQNLGARSEEVRDLQAAGKRLETEVGRLEKSRTELLEVAKSNRTEIATLREQLARAAAELAQSTNQVELFKKSLDAANDNIKRQNEAVTRQNTDLKKLAEERNEVVAKFNKVAGEFNELVKKWNAQQAELKKPGGTPAPGTP